MCTYLVFLGTALLPVVANQLPDGHTDYGCRENGATKVDAAGYYFYVIGREAQRAAIARVPGATFLPFSAAQPYKVHLIGLRNKLPTPGFRYAIQKVALNGSPATAATATGPYYPHAAICPLSTLVAKGPQACLPHP
jgi:hypothetical protein